VEAAVAELGAPLDQRGHLLLTSLAVPPQRPDDVCGQVSALCCVEVRRTGVVHAGVLPDDRVLPARDAHRVQVGLPGEETLVVRLGRRARSMLGHDVHRALVQGSGRMAVRVALVATVRRLGGLTRDAGQLEGAGVHPGAVMVAVGQEHRSVRHDRVEVGRDRRTARKGGHGPPAAEDPREIGVGVGVRLDRGEVVLARRSLREVATGAFEPALHGVHVGVDEPGTDQATRHVDDARTGRYVDVADGRDAPVLDEDGRGPEMVVAVEDGAVHECGGHPAIVPPQAARRVGAAFTSPSRRAGTGAAVTGAGRRRSLMPTASAAKAKATAAAATVKKTLIQNCRVSGSWKSMVGSWCGGFNL
jgi:hypothetical protein